MFLLNPRPAPVGDHPLTSRASQRVPPTLNYQKSRAHSKKLSTSNSQSKGLQLVETS
jgi:hypothetical protein